MGPGRRWKQQPGPLQRRLLFAPLELVTLPQCLACLLWPSLSLLTASPRTTFQLLVAGSPFVPSFQLDTTLENMLSYLSLAPHLLLRPFLPSSHLSSRFPWNVALGRSQLEWNKGREKMAVPLTLCHCLLTLSQISRTAEVGQQRLSQLGELVAHLTREPALFSPSLSCPLWLGSITLPGLEEGKYVKEDQITPLSFLHHLKSFWESKS